MPCFKDIHSYFMFGLIDKLTKNTLLVRSTMLLYKEKIQMNADPFWQKTNYKEHKDATSQALHKKSAPSTHSLYLFSPIRTQKTLIYT